MRKSFRTGNNRMFETANSTHFHFTVKLQVLSFEALEAYVIEVVLVCNHLHFDITKLLSQPAFLSFEGLQPFGLHGVIQHVRRGAVERYYAWS